MSDTLYLQLDQNIQVTHPHIYLQDIAKLSCSNSKILNLRSTGDPGFQKSNRQSRHLFPWMCPRIYDRGKIPKTDFSRSSPQKMQQKNPQDYF